MKSAFHLAALCVCSLIPLRVQAQSPAEIAPHDCLVIGRVGSGGRNPIHRDVIEARIVAGKWTAPKAGDTLLAPDGSVQEWRKLSANKDGVFSGQELAGGYADFSIPSDNDRVMILEASGHSMVYVNGEPRTGDPYSNGTTRLPIKLHKGTNELLFLSGRGQLRLKLIPLSAAAMLDTHDLTLPDLRVGEKIHAYGAVIVLNATEQTAQGLKLRVRPEHLSTRTVAVPPIPPLATRKVAFPLEGAAPPESGTVPVVLELETPGRHGIADTAKFDLRNRKRTETYKCTFLSDIDGSVQYYAVNPAHPLSKNEPPPALFLTLHGAGVEAIGQADAYESKSWGDIVAPTNRRPFGFDWEDWGQLDAMEVLDIAQKTLHTDPLRTYLTGHSMGGHGTWHVGVTYPDRFAAIGPSAGWISFWSYAGSTRLAHPTPLQELLLRASNPSDTLALEHNYAQEGVYILHGGADDNVPVEQAREMNQRLSSFHHDVVYFEQPGAGHWWDVSDEPGADCVDWQPMYDFFAHHLLPANETIRQVDFTTANPGISAWDHWACIEQQSHPLQLSTISIRFDPGKRRFVGKTENVARLALDLNAVSAEGGNLSVDLDGQKLSDIPYPVKAKRLWLAHSGTNWTVADALPPTAKSPLRNGPFKLAFQHRMCFVYGTKGTPEENAWALAKARYDAETFWYRGNGSIDVLPDTAFDPKKDQNRSVVLYGNADTNGAWSALLSDSPVTVHRDQVRVGEKSLSGSDLACVFLRPRPGSETACVAVISGSGLVGMRLTERLPYFVSGVDFPDCMVIGAEELEKGFAGVRTAGFFGPDWSVDRGEFVWQ